MIRSVVVVALLMLSLSTVTSVFVLVCDPVRLLFGGGVATWSVGGLSQFALFFELTLQVTFVLLFLVGAVAVDSYIVHVYGELVLNFVVIVGVGVGYGCYEVVAGAASDVMLYFFVVVLIFVYFADFFSNLFGFFMVLWWGYLLLYYRFVWGPWLGVAHEGGVMFKMSYWLEFAIGKFGG